MLEICCNELISTRILWSLHLESTRFAALNPVGAKKDMEQGEWFSIIIFTDKILGKLSCNPGLLCKGIFISSRGIGPDKKKVIRIVNEIIFWTRILFLWLSCSLSPSLLPLSLQISHSCSFSLVSSTTSTSFEKKARERKKCSSYFCYKSIQRKRPFHSKRCDVSLSCLCCLQLSKWRIRQNLKKSLNPKF